MIERFDRRWPRLAFARRVPPRRIVNRLRRRAEHRLGFMSGIQAPPATLRSVSEWPVQLFPPRTHVAARTAQGWRFAFLGIEKHFGAIIDWRCVAGEIGQLWRMNLHYFEYLEVLGAEQGMDAIRQWILGNPPGGPGAQEAAWNVYALSIRAVCWLQWLARTSEHITAADREMIAHSLAQQVAFIARFPETDIGGNHLIKNVKALAYAGRVFDGEIAERWARRARALILPELGIQILSDGFHFERSPSYHCQVAADLIETATAQQALAPVLLPIAERLVANAAAMTHPDGCIAQFNDAGLHMAYDAATLAEALRRAGGRVANVPACVSLPEAGLASLRTAGLSTYLKFGPPGPGELPAHAHGDTGSIEISAGAHRMIVDQGVFEYVEGSRRQASRSAAHHNVTAPESRDLADFFGAFRCGWMPTPSISRLECGDGALVVQVAHDGFATKDARIVVSRRVEARASRVMIEDRVEGLDTGSERPGDWASRFLLHPDWQALQQPGGWRLVGPNALSILVECDAPGTLHDALWWPDMGVAISTVRLVIPWDHHRSSLRITFRKS